MSTLILPMQPSRRVIGSSVFVEQLTRITVAPSEAQTLPIVGAAIALASSKILKPDSGRRSEGSLAGPHNTGGCS